MARLLLLSTTTGYQLRSFSDAAERAGVEILFATDRCHMLDDPWQDRAIAVRFHDEAASLDAIVQSARQRPLDGVIAVGDRPVALAALVAAALRLPGNPPDAAAASANKLETRARLIAAGLPVPWFTSVPLSELSESGVAGLHVEFPCVVKPLGLSGSRGVVRADSSTQLATAINRVARLLARPDVRAMRSGLEEQLLVEGYIDGAEFAVEGVLTRGELRTFAIFDKPDPLDGPLFEETIYVTPSALPQARQRDIGLEVQRAATAIGLLHGPVHAECRVGPEGIFILEVAARPIGGLCSRALRFSPDAAPLEEVLLRHALGEDTMRYVREEAASGVMMIPIPKRGIFKRVENEDDARAVEGVEEIRMTAKQDQLLEPLPEGASYLGFIFARASSPQRVAAALREAHGRLRFVIDPAIEVRRVKGP
jgi:ATP-grasp domain/L-amino acid ligase C-terminal domain 2/ATP-grasp N-terminal domain